MDKRHGIAIGLVAALLILCPTGSAWAKGRKAPAKAAAAESSPKKALNACGCYADLSGRCFCGRKGKCECPGECEPKGCEEKRARQMQKEIAAETKKAAEADRKARLEEKKRAEQPEPEPKPKPKAPDKEGVGQ